MPDSPSSPNAVFLSYAREDADAASRIAEALRGFGVEVWFDQSELRGGDMWDEKIRGQIRSCTLFLAVVSAHTQARREGYFRREWKLAVERTSDMAAGVPFLVPVVIDNTAESRALVPVEFLRVQWTPLPGGLPTPQFIEQVKRLLVKTSEPELEAGRPRPAPRDEPPSPDGFGAPRGVASPAQVIRAPVRPALGPWLRARLVWIVGASVAVVLLGALGWNRLAQISDGDSAARRSAPLTTEKPTPAVTDKSIAVLPFENRSSDKENAFFADGIHDDILTNLAHIRELRVVSRTSVMEYRESKKKVPQIAKELGVTWILEGSVQRAGNKVRVTGQLIRAGKDEHVWAKNFDRDLTDIFAIQSELAQAIAAELKAVLSPQEKNLITRRPTENLAAYDLYLRSRAVVKSGASLQAHFQERESLLQSAVALDPTFAIAWGELAVAHVENIAAYVDTTPARLAKAKAAIDRALALAPDSPDVIRCVGVYYSFGLKEYARASDQFEKLVLLQPNDTEARSRLAEIQLFQGRWPEYITSRRTVTQLDPSNSGAARVLASAYRMVRRFDEAIGELRRLMALRPDQPQVAVELARMAFLATGSIRETDELLVRLEARNASSPEVIGLRMSQALRRRDLAEFTRLDRLHPAISPDGSTNVAQATMAAAVFRSQGDLAAARARLESILGNLRARLELEPANIQLLRDAALVGAILGDTDDAQRRIDRAVELIPESGNARVGVGTGVVRSQVLAWIGDKDRAISEIARLLRVPGDLNIHELKHNPLYAPLRGDPRFEALLSDPKNNAPLF